MSTKYEDRRECRTCGKLTTHIVPFGVRIANDAPCSTCHPEAYMDQPNVSLFFDGVFELSWPAVMP